MNPFTVVEDDYSVDWQHRSRCARHPKYWNVDNLPDGKDGFAIAKAMCEPCPVARQCAQFHRDNSTGIGHVVAGLALVAGRLNKQLAAQHLAAVASGVPISDSLKAVYADAVADQHVKYCADPDCGHPMMTRDRWLAAGGPTEYRKVGGHGLCQACYARARYHEERAS